MLSPVAGWRPAHVVVRAIIRCIAPRYKGMIRYRMIIPTGAGITRPSWRAGNPGPWRGFRRYRPPCARPCPIHSRACRDDNICRCRSRPRRPCPRRRRSSRSTPKQTAGCFWRRRGPAPRTAPRRPCRPKSPMFSSSPNSPLANTRIPAATAEHAVWVPSSPVDHRYGSRVRRHCGAIGTISGHPESGAVNRGRDRLLCGQDRGKSMDALSETGYRNLAADAHIADVRVAAPAWRYWTLALLVAMATFSMVDKMLIAVLIDPLKREFGMSDTQAGVLTGISFSLFFALAG